MEKAFGNNIIKGKALIRRKLYMIKNPQGQDIKGLIHLAISRGLLLHPAELSEEITKSRHCSWNIPVHATNLAARIQRSRKLAAAQYIIRNSTVTNHTNTEVELRSDKHLSKRTNKSVGPLTSFNTSEQETYKPPNRLDQMLHYVSSSS